MGSRGNVLAGALLTLSVVSALLSLYLIYDHFKDEESSFCDVAAAVSCSRVRRSAFSEIVNVPIAVFGFLFSCATIYASVHICFSPQRVIQGHYLTLTFYSHVAGSLFVFYLIGAEIYLQTICPLCTLVHIVQMASLLVSYFLHYEQLKLFTLQDSVLYLRKPLALFGVVLVLTVVAFNMIPGSVDDHATDSSLSISDTRADEKFAECLLEQGWTCFGRSGCAWCERQQHLFANHRDIFAYVDCNQENWTTRCQELSIQAFPTWLKLGTLGEEQRWKGYASIETLHHLSECPLPQVLSEA